MNIAILGTGMMGRAIAFDLDKFSDFDKITLCDKDKLSIISAEKFLKDTKVNFSSIDVGNKNRLKTLLNNYDILISAIPYRYNYELARIAIDTKTHFIDLGGNNTIVQKELELSDKARKCDVTVIPDCGLAPGLTSIITKDIVEKLDSVDYVKLRVGGLPTNPKPPLNYQIVFSPYGLINEYIEDAIVLKNHKIVTKKSMTELEKISFTKPYQNMEAFITSGGCSTLPYTFKNKIKNLDYKTIRYPGHCEKFKLLLDLGLADTNKIKLISSSVSPRDFLVKILFNNLPQNQKDVVLMKCIGKGLKDNKSIKLEYTMIDYFDSKNKMTSMMRTTAYPVSITAQMISNELIRKHGAFCSEHVIPCKEFLNELKKRDIIIKERKICE